MFSKFCLNIFFRLWVTRIDRGRHFRRAGPRQKVYFDSDEVHAGIVTCGGLCPGLNTGGYRGFYARNTIALTPKVVNDIHKRGGTILGTSRGGHDTSKIVDSIQDRGINQVYIIGGDGTQKERASVIFEVICFYTTEDCALVALELMHKSIVHCFVLLRTWLIWSEI
ncbi:hypothetical protein NC651_016308 [Populus alba x Populus x berolinensis]|nr:hypothetical protein NC651_016308 [Populus alba x Populus x berolinensis]